MTDRAEIELLLNATGMTLEEIKTAVINCDEHCSCIDCPEDERGYCDRSFVINYARCLIELLESERDAALAKVPKWISVKERLPEDDGEYLVLKVHNYRKDDGWMAQEVALFLRTRDPEWVIGNLCEVTHWMPLPEPPKDTKGD